MSSRRKDSFRGHHISEVFYENFKKSFFYTELYLQHRDELILCVRDGFINLYYNCDAIAKIQSSDKEPQSLVAEVASYYLTGETPSKGYVKMSGQELLQNYDIIKSNSNKRRKLEKQAQERLFITNNSNARSDWFCIDVEYTKSFARKSAMEHWRFDIIAVSRRAPFRVALIELKYGNGAIGGRSGITKHVKDYYSFHHNHSFELLKPELASIITSLDKIGVEVPETLRHIRCEDFAKRPEYYFITLNNRREAGQSTLPMETMAGYLFTQANGDWKASRYSRRASTDGYYATVGGDRSFKPVFLFSPATLPELGIRDILDESSYIRKEVAGRPLKKAYKTIQGDRQARLIEQGATVFYSASNGGLASWDHNGHLETRASRKVLKDEDREKNLYEPIRKEVMLYVENAHISWWHMAGESNQEVTAHTLSSQVSCFNHLFAIRNDEAAVKAVLKAATGISFDEILPSFIEEHTLISFEFVFHNKQLLHENHETRGEKCTSIDALIYARKGDEKWLVPIEWKYTETYDKSKPCFTNYRRYQDLVAADSQLPSWLELYHQDPYYELARQTLLMEKMIDNYPDIATRYFHIVVVPRDNTEMRADAERFGSSLKQGGTRAFQIIDPSELLQPIGSLYPDLIAYLKTRYW